MDEGAVATISSVCSSHELSLLDELEMLGKGRRCKVQSIGKVEEVNVKSHIRKWIAQLLIGATAVSRAVVWEDNIYCLEEDLMYKLKDVTMLLLNGRM